MLAIKSNEPPWLETDWGPAQVKAAQVPLEEWWRLSAGDGAKGPRVYDWTRVPLRPMKEPGKGYPLLVRRGIAKPGELVRVAGARWAFRRAMRRPKGR